MSIDRLPITKIHAQVPTALGPLLTSGEASSLAISYLIACKAEGKSPKTLEAYSMVLGQFARFSQEEREPFSASNVRLFLISLQDRQLSPHTVHLYYRSLNTFFNWLEAEGLIAKNPMANIKPPKLPRPVVKPFSQQDIKNLLLLCSGDKFLVSATGL